MEASEKAASVSLFVPSVVLLVLNLWDALATLTWVKMAVGTEVNPLMAWALEGSPLLFVGLKLLLVQGGTFLLTLYSSRRAARLALWSGLILYSILAAYHLAFLARLLTN